MKFNHYSKTAATLVLTAAAVFAQVGSASGLELVNRSLSLSSVVGGGSTRHTASFQFPSTSSVGSIVFEYCTSPLMQVPCSSPAGLDASSAFLDAQSGETGFSVFSQTANVVILSRAPSATGLQLNSYSFDNVTNPTNLGQFYLRISSFSSTDGTGSLQDFGATVGVITRAVTITTEVPPILNFCAGVSIPGLCDSASGTFLSLGSFVPNSTSRGTTQFMVGTNANFGYVVKVFGTTLTSGNNAIPALGLPSASTAGQSQFGMNLRANSSPPVGVNPSPGGGAPDAQYNSPNLFKFASGDTLAGSASVSDNQRFTVSYIVNVTGAQAPGIYNSTFTYTCTATF